MPKIVAWPQPGRPTTPEPFPGPHPWADPMFYGAQGDGINDDSTAFQTAVNVAGANGTGFGGLGGYVLLGAYNFKIGASLSVPSNVSFLSFGAVISGVGAATVTPIISIGIPGTFGPWVVVTAYGAKGDGVTDDTSAIQSAINAAGQAGGGIVYFPPGTYAVSSLTIGYDNVVLLGAGERSTVISTSSATADVIVSTSQTAVQISDLTFTASVARTAGALFNWTSMVRSAIHDVTLGDLFNLGTFTTCAQLTLQNIRYAHGTGSVNRGFYFNGCTSVHCENFTWSCGSATLAASQGWLMIDTSCDTLLFSDIEIAVSSGTGGSGAACLWIQDQVGGGHPPRWLRFENCSFQAGTSSAGIHIQDGAFDCYFVNSYLASCQDGLDVQGGKNLRFVNVVLASNQQYGANLTSSGGKAISYVYFEDCTFDSNSQATNNTYDHLLISATNVSVVSIRGCLFTNALLSGANKAKYAIENACTTTYEAECTIEASGWATAAVLETAAMDGEIKVIPGISGISTALTGAFAAVANSDIGAQISDFGSGNAYMMRAVAIEKGLTAADSGRVRIFDTGTTAVFAADIPTAAPDTGAFRVTSAWAALLSARHTLRLEVENATAARGNVEQGWYEVRRVG